MKSGSQPEKAGYDEAQIQFGWQGERWLSSVVGGEQLGLSTLCAESRLTRPSRGRPTAVFARFRPPLTSNVERPLSPAATDRSWPLPVDHGLTLST